MSRPEEKVRQDLVTLLVEEYGYPSSSLVIEKKLSLFPHISHPHVPDRRIDIVVLAKEIHPNHLFYPLLLIECKETHLTKHVVEQVIGYNYYMGAYFIAIASKVGFLLGWQEESYQWREGLLPYQKLLEWATLYGKNLHDENTATFSRETSLQRESRKTFL